MIMFLLLSVIILKNMKGSFRDKEFRLTKTTYNNRIQLSATAVMMRERLAELSGVCYFTGLYQSSG